MVVHSSHFDAFTRTPDTAFARGDSPDKIKREMMEDQQTVSPAPTARRHRCALARPGAGRVWVPAESAFWVASDNSGVAHVYMKDIHGTIDV